MGSASIGLRAVWGFAPAWSRGGASCGGQGFVPHETESFFNSLYNGKMLIDICTFSVSATYNIIINLAYFLLFMGHVQTGNSTVVGNFNVAILMENQTCVLGVRRNDYETFGTYYMCTETKCLINSLAI